MKKASKFFLQGMFNHFVTESGIRAELNSWRIIKHQRFFVSSPIDKEDGLVLLRKMMKLLPKECHQFFGLTPSIQYKNKYRICFKDNDDIYDYILNQTVALLNRHYPPLFQADIEQHFWQRREERIFFYNYHDFCTHQFISQEEMERVMRMFDGTYTEEDRRIDTDLNKEYENHYRISKDYLTYLSAELPGLNRRSHYSKSAAVEVTEGGITFDTFYTLVKKEWARLAQSSLKQLAMHFFKAYGFLHTTENIKKLPEDLVDEMGMNHYSL